MRVLTFLHSFEPGGVERVALRLVREWRRMGVDAPLFFGRPDGPMANDVGCGLAVEVAKQPPYPVAGFETLWMIAKLPGVIRRTRPDLLFCAGNTYGIVAVAMKLLLGRNCPPIVAKISNDLDRSDQPGLARPFYRLWLKILGWTFDHVVGMAEPARAEIRERLAIADDRVAIVPDPALSRPMIENVRAPRLAAERQGEGRRFVAVSRFAPQKNIALMLRAFRRGAAPTDHLTLIGDGAERTRLETLARRLGIASQVHFHGYDPSPVDRLGAFDILLLSSNFEGVPAVILEALAANLTIVATDCSRSMSTLLQQGTLGALVPVGDEQAFAAAIAQARPGTSCPRLSRAQAERFTVEHAAELYLDVFDRSCGLPPHRRPANDTGSRAHAQALQFGDFHGTH